MSAIFAMRLCLTKANVWPQISIDFKSVLKWINANTALPRSRKMLELSFIVRQPTDWKLINCFLVIFPAFLSFYCEISN